MSKQAYTNIDLSDATEFISVADLPYGTSLFDATTKGGEWLVSVEKNACSSTVHVWRKVVSANGHVHSRYDADAELHGATLGNSAALYGYFVDGFFAYAEAQATVRQMMRVSGVDLHTF